MRHSREILVQSIIIGGLLLGVAIGGTLATESLPSTWKSSSNIPPSPAQEFNGTSLASEYNNILSLINLNQFSNASLQLSGLSFVNYPTDVQPLAQQVISQVGVVNRSMPLASAYLGDTLDLISKGLLSNATIAVNNGCTQAILANSSLYNFENITTPQLDAVLVPTSLYSANLFTLHGKVVSLARQCTILLRELRSTFQSNGTEDCVSLSGYSYCVTLSSAQRSVEVGGSLPLRGSFLKNGAPVSGELISFYLNGTYIANSTTLSDGSYRTNVTLPFLYAENATVWAVASQNSSLGLTFAIGSNAIYIHLLFNSTRIILDSGEIRSQTASPTDLPGYQTLVKMHDSLLVSSISSSEFG